MVRWRDCVRPRGNGGVAATSAIPLGFRAWPEICWFAEPPAHRKGPATAKQRAVVNAPQRVVWSGASLPLFATHFARWQRGVSSQVSAQGQVTATLPPSLLL